MPQDGNFEIALARGADGYQLSVRSPAGEDSGDVRLDPAQLGADPRTLQSWVLASATQSGMADPNPEQLLRQVGQALFEAVFPDWVAELFRSSRNEAEGAGGRLRILLRLRPAELAVLPWELLYSDRYGGYLWRRSPMVRYVEVPEPVRPLTVAAPLRVLGMTALPAELDLLDADAEQRRLQQLLAPLQERGLVVVDWVPGQSWEAARDTLRAGCYHVFHFIGHGWFDPEQGEGVIAFAGAGGRQQPVRASALADLLSAGDAMPRLVVLNSCQTGAGGDVNVFSSTAATLVRTVPAVVAMQFEITDGAAALFSAAFYQALIHNLGVDEAVRQARIELSGPNSDTLEWVTPVLYLRSPDTRLFDFTQRPWPDPNFDFPSRGQQRFVGRDRELAKCWEKLSKNGFLIVHGIDGQGKTALAKVYEEEHQHDYDLRYYVPASEEASVSTALEKLALKLEVVTASEPTAGELRSALRRKLEDWDRWLLIFDNVRDWKSIQDYIPPIPPLRGHIIATTSNIPGVQDLPDLRPAYLKLGRLSPAASKEYLIENIDGASDGDAERLAHDLGYLAAALSFAAKKYAATGIPETRSATRNDANLKLRELWQDTFYDLQNESPLAYSLLEFCSLFASDPIPEAILTLRPKGNAPFDELRGALTTQYSDLVGTLQEHSLLEVQARSHTITVHILLQAYLRENMAPGRRHDLLSAAIDLFLDAFHESWFAGNFPRCALALPHAEACLEILDQYEITLPQASNLMVMIAHYHRTRDEIFKALAFQERALRARENVLERALRARENVLAKDRIRVARSLNDLGIVLKEIGKPGEAIKNYERSLKIETSVESPDGESVAICRDNLGEAWAASGEYARAIELHKLVYSFWITENPRHSGAAQALCNMGYAYYLLGDLAQAEKVLRKAVEIGAEAVAENTGFDELALAGMRHNLGEVLRARGGVYNAWRAKEILDEALNVRSRERGDEHLSVIETRTVLARIFRCLGEHAKAEDEVESAAQALDQIRRSDALGFGPPGSPDLSSKYECAVLIAEGELRFAKGNYEDAKQCFERARGLDRELARQGVPLPSVEQAELMEDLGRVDNVESPGCGENWLVRAAAKRDALDKARAEAPKIPEELDR